MDIGTLIDIFFVWNFIGAFICLIIAYTFNAGGWKVANPYWCYRLSHSLNWFGAILVSLLYNALCPFGAVCYWFYKLCTVGRR